MTTTTPSFVLELPLAPTATQAKVIRTKLEVGRHLYNALLSEAEDRLQLMRKSPQFLAAKALPKTAKKERRAAFAKVRNDFGFTEYSLHKFATTARTSWLAEHIDANTAQTLATRAFRAVNRLCFGQARKVRYKSKGRGLDSLEGKTNKQGLRFILDAQEGKLVWGELEVGAIIDWSDEVVRHGLASPIKYVRLVRRPATSERAKGADCTAHRYYIQLILKGKPYQKRQNVAGNLTVGLDLGPSTVAIVSEQAEVARLELLGARLVPNQKNKRRLQRKMERKRRAANPQNYDDKGRIKRGAKKWQESGGYREAKRRLAAQERKLATQRKSEHGRLVNEIIRAGKTIKVEKVSYKGWQKQYGKSIGLRAPAMFIERLRRTAEGAGGTLLAFSTHKTRLSQVCHGCGQVKKKALSERWHDCSCGVLVQRDLYSAYLAAHVDRQTETLSIDQCVKHWSGAETRLFGAIESLLKRAKEGVCRVNGSSE